VQLASTGNGEVVWARRYDSVEAGGPESTLNIGQHVVNAVRNRGSRGDGDGKMRGDPNSPAGLTMMGWRDLDRRKSMDDVYRARGRFEAAVRADGESVIALNGLAATYSLERVDPATRLSAAQMATHERLVDRARRLAPDDATALQLWDGMQIMRGRADLALPAFEKAGRLVPSYPFSHIMIAQSLLMLGRADEVQAHADRAVELSAADPRRESHAHALAAEAALMLGLDERARDRAQRAIAAFPANTYAHAVLAAVEALAGQSEKAHESTATLLTLWPDATVANFDHRRRSSDPTYLAQRARFYEGLRLSGLPPG
jgi:tetratricopeptide (TPR) repeat protein